MSTTTKEKPLVLITGCSGLIGSRIIEDLSPDYRVIGLDIVEPQNAPSAEEWLECDLTDDDSVLTALSTIRGKYGLQFASVIHIAAYYDFSGEPSPLYETLTVEGTRRLLQRLQEFQVEQFVFSSTLLVMKPAEEDELLTETSDTQAEWEYPRSKLRAERVIREERGTFPVAILRLAGAYDEDCHSVPIAQQISRIYEKKLESYFFPGKKTHGQAFVHLDDLVEGFHKTVDHRQRLQPQELLLIAEPDVMSYAELQEQVGELIHGREWPTIRIPKVVAKIGAWAQEKVAGKEDSFIKPWMVDLADQHYPVEIQRARELLQWTPRYRLRDTLPEMIKRLQQNPRQWYETNKLPFPSEAKESTAGKADAS
ncbi:MAG: NAD-dependent epimerase/dehydratase family protein [Candidatus Binatia bacterium]